MKPSPAPEVPGNTPWERFDSAVRKVLTVSKETVVQAEKEQKRTRARKRKKAKA